MSTHADQERGVVFPRADDGRRSTAALGRAVVADALRPVDATGALAAAQETGWRSGYLPHFHRLVVAGLASPEAAVRIARAGLDSLHERMRAVYETGEEQPLAGWLDAGTGAAPATTEVAGTADPEPELTLPYRGRRLAGDDAPVPGRPDFADA